MTIPHFRMRQKANGTWWWDLVGPDGNVMTTGDWEDKTEEDCYLSIMAFKQMVSEAEITANSPT